MLKDGKYNIDVFWPDSLKEELDKVLSKRYYVSRTKHYEEKTKKLHIPCGLYKKALSGSVIEADVINGHVTKIVTRQQDRKFKDSSLCFAVLLGGFHRCGSGYIVEAVRIKTVWINKSTDNHSTLKTEGIVKK